MKQFIYFIIFMCILSIGIGCRSRPPIYVPVESKEREKEYIDRWQKDSIYLHDSIFLKQKGDTIWLERYKTYYKEKLVRDSVFITDSVRVEVPIPVEIPTPYYPKWLIVLACLGAGFSLIAIYKIIRFFKP